MSRFAALLLDLDGTLLDTAPDMVGALNGLRIEQGLAPLPMSRLRPHVSHGAVGLVSQAFPEVSGDAFEALRLRFLELYAERLAEETRLFDGLEAVLAAAETRSVPWGVVTNKPARYTNPLLAQLGLDRRAACVVSGDTVAERKPHPLPLLHAAALIGADPRECVYVGDAERDIQAGRAAGMRTVVAAYGYIGEEEDTSRWHADGVARSPGDLISWLGARGARDEVAT